MSKYWQTRSRKLTSETESVLKPSLGSSWEIRTNQEPEVFMCQLSLRSTLATNTFCRRNLLKPEQATGLASCNWIVHIKAVCWIFFFFFHFTSYPPLSNIPDDTFLHRDLAMGYTDAKTCTSSFLTAAVWNVGRRSSSRGAVSHQAALTYCSAPVRNTSFACPTHRRWGIRADAICGFFLFSLHAA